MSSPTLSIARPHQPVAGGRFTTTDHAARRMSERGVSPEAVEAALTYGRPVWTRGACVYAIGRKEVARYADEEVDLGPLEGVQVVCAPDGAVLTVYRNRDFRGLRPRRRTSRTRRDWRAADRPPKKS